MRFTRIAVIIALLLILLIVVISYLYWNHPDKRVDLSNYFTVLAGFSIIVLVVTFVLNSHLRDQEANDKTREAHASLRRRLYDKAIAPFIDHYPHLNRLYSQIYPEQVTTTSFDRSREGSVTRAGDCIGTPSNYGGSSPAQSDWGLGGRLG